ncbi:transposase (plasmid) [Skermanella mucosa]|uniref:hypothetical protein n=1 Tax=Skermanella mucosa TaxID=1789672 RepID=UPI00192AE899|nr:hypothetical protein [Skermanella mucosa]UEM24764.1 transposase [Skermanella mucosa]
MEPATRPGAACREGGSVGSQAILVAVAVDWDGRLQIVRALTAETHEEWLETTRYLNMDHLREHKKKVMRALELAA